MTQVFEPLVLDACRSVPSVAQVDPGVDRQFAEQLGGRLALLAVRTMVLELNQARACGRLRAATPAGRFTEFTDQLSTEAGLAGFFERNQGLAQTLSGTCLRAADARRELLSRFGQDRAEIAAALLGGTDPGRLVSIEPSGDSHGGGRSVAVLTFAGGQKVVYKPRPLDLHAHFNEFLQWLGRQSRLDLRAVRLLTKRDYGWMEFIEHQPCSGPAEVQRFYQRQGALLALLHVLDGTDIHYENLIASGDQPVLVDVETLFHPADTVGSVIRDDPATTAINGSVLRTALLPLLLAGDHGVIDLSGLGGDEGVQLPDAMVDWADAGLDTMRLIRRPAVAHGAQNRPRVGGCLVEPRDHQKSLLAGFLTAYDAIAAGRAELLGPDGLLERCAADGTRYVARHTQTYATLLDESTHPDLLRDAGARRRFFGLLRDDRPDDSHLRLVDHELADLERGDVPLFTSRPGSRDVTASDGTCLPDLLRTTGLGRAEAKILALNEIDRGQQEWLITASLSTRPEPVSHQGTRVRSYPAATAPPDPQRLLAAATGIADEILGRALGRDGRANWIGLELVDDLYWAVLPAGAGLANGYLGPALFLAEMSRITGADRYVNLAAEVIRPLPWLFEAWAADPALTRAVGPGFHGLGGVGYALSRLSDLGLGSELDGWLTTVIELAEQLAHDPDRATGYGFGTGDAGGLAAMMAIGSSPDRAAALRVAATYADRLAQVAEEGGGLGPAAGFAHGSAGVAWSLLRYASADGRPRHRDAGLLALAAPAGGLLEVAADHGWCSGDAGTALARFAAGAIPSRDYLRQARVRPQLLDMSLCHGEVGALEPLVWLAGQGDDEAAAVLRHRTALVVGAIEQEGTRCGTPGGVSSPGLMTGLAGIGYGLLRAGFSSLVPSVLLLEPPAADRSYRSP
nr:type 2 lanthipeptide synthetase LanM family protein [Streptomyces sp. SID13031]